MAKKKVAKKRAGKIIELPWCKRCYRDAIRDLRYIPGTVSVMHKDDLLCPSCQKELYEAKPEKEYVYLRRLNRRELRLVRQSAKTDKVTLDTVKCPSSNCHNSTRRCAICGFKGYSWDDDILRLKKVTVE